MSVFRPEKVILDRRSLLRHLASAASLGAVGLSAGCSEEIVEDSAGFETSVSALRKGSEGYEKARRLLIPWNTATPARYPDMIARVRSEDDIVNAITYARENGMEVSVRCSGHNTPGSAVRDGGITIDISKLNNVSVDSVRKVAEVQPGVLCAQLLQAALSEGLAFPVANCPTVAMGGFLLGGGLGLNKAQFGSIACYSVRAADIILADGRKVTVSANENPDLFWAARGAGPGFFGIVTRFELELFEEPQSVHKSTYFLSLDDISAITKSLDEIGETADGRTSNSILLMQRKSSEEKVCMLTATAFANSDAEAAELLTPYAASDIAALSSSKSEGVQSALPQMLHMGAGAGRIAASTLWADDSQALVVLAEHFRKSPSRRSVVSCSYGTPVPSLRQDACFSSIGKHYLANYLTWDDPTDDTINEQWLREAVELMAPYTVGHYVNDADGIRWPDQVSNSFSAANWERLQQLRKKHDPEGVFHSYLGYKRNHPITK